jgi:hypothetical protein
MPAAADITIKKNDGTTNIVYNTVVASGGDKSPAIFRANSAPGYPGQRPEFRMTAQPNGDRTGRKMRVEYTYPTVYTDTTTSISNVLTRANVQTDVFVPANMPDADLLEFAAQFGNLMASALVKSCLSSGFAAS